ncbi:MAG: polysaccharide biosynthesis tyrosine autokinase [Magnetococcales bacterium]|nr:polysaccharide biosynthesis tyrosine autokinase [Nitrospirota bacterium]
MPDDSYRIVFKGDILAGYDKNRVAEALTRVFNVGQKKAEMLFGGQSVIIKKDVSYEVAKKYKASMNKAGADCLIISNADKQSSVPDKQTGNHAVVKEIKKTDKYAVLFRGKILPGYDEISVKGKLDRLYRINIKCIDSIFCDRPVVIVRGVPYDIAKRHKDLLNKIGVECSICLRIDEKREINSKSYGVDDLPGGSAALTKAGASRVVKEKEGVLKLTHDSKTMSKKVVSEPQLKADTTGLTVVAKRPLDYKPKEQLTSDDMKEQVVTIPCNLNIPSNLEVPDGLISREVVNGNSKCLSGSAIYYKQREEMVSWLTVGQGTTREDGNNMNTEKQPPITEIRSHAIQQKSSKQGAADVIGQSDGLQGKDNAAAVSKGTVSDDAWEETDHRPNTKQSSAPRVGKATDTKVCLAEKTLSLIKKNGKEQSIFDGHLTCASREQGYRKILVTSANNLEGKTITAISIAYTISKSSYDSVLLVDGNIHKPAIHKLFDTVNTPGLTDYLIDRQQYDDSIQMTEYGNLSIMSSGSEISNPNHLYDVAIFDERINRLKNDFKYIIYDGHSVLTYPDTSIIASYFDAIVMVVECEKTKYDVMAQAKDKLEAVGGKVWGIVMNKRKFYIPRFLYGKI